MTQLSSLPRTQSSPGLPTVFIASDIRLHRDGLTWGLAGYGRLVVVGTGDTVDTAFAQLATLRPAVVLVDMVMVDALDLIRAASQAFPDMRVVAFAVGADEQSVFCCVEAGAAAYVPREAAISDLVATVERVLRGEAPCPDKLVPSLFRRLAVLARDHSGAEQLKQLTIREQQIVDLLEQGLSNKEIATHLGIEVATAKNHVHNILEKLHIHRRTQIAARLGPRRLRAPSAQPRSSA